MIPKPLYSYYTCIEIAIRIVLIIIMVQLEKTAPFKRQIQPNEWSLYQYPFTDDYVHFHELYPFIILVSLMAILVNYIVSRDLYDVSQAILSLTLALGYTLVLTELIKVLVGRPRPDFFSRCFPDGNINEDIICTGDQRLVMQGRKSFPSGHTSFAFAGMGFLTWYLLGKLNTLNRFGRGESYRLTICILPLVCATIIAISRTCDYRHHWQDVVVGALIGLGFSYLCYRQYYPSVSSEFCDCSYYSKIKKFHRCHIRGMNSKDGNSCDGEHDCSSDSDSNINWY